jgi:hypothetical protein
MKTISNLLLIAFVAVSISSLRAQDANFPGVERAMPPQDYEAAGLQKLSAEEREKLNDFIRRYVSSSQEKAATAAVDRAVKEHKAVSPPQVLQSRIVGPFTGYTGRTVFTLENGQRWAEAQHDSRHYPQVDSPPVLVLKDMFGYRMYIAGGGDLRVTQLK